MTGKEAKRLASLDAMRGLAVLGMLPFHLVFFGGFFALGSGGGTNVFTALPFPIEFRPPLGTGLILFFFVTGVSLAASISRKKSFIEIGRRTIIRYGAYYLVSILFEIILWSVIGWRLDISFILSGYFSFFQPIEGLSIAAVLAFPLIFLFNWKKLLVISSGLALAVGIALYAVFLPQASSLPVYSPLNPLLIGLFSALKGLPIELFGASIGKLVLEGKDIKKKMILIGIAIVTVYVVVPFLLGSGMLHMLLMVWSYPSAILFTLGSSLFLFGLFQFVEARKISLSPLKVLGRLSFFVYFGHWMILLPSIQILGGVGVISKNLGLLLVLMVISLTVAWVLTYFYGRWRWGSPSTW